MKKLTVQPSDLPPRPDFGTIGTNIKLRTNFFPITVPKKTFYEYDIVITPAVAIRRVKRRIFQLAEQTPDWTTHGLKGKVAHDHTSKLISITKLPQPLVITIVFFDEDEIPKKPEKKGPKDKKKPPKEYTLTFNYTKDLNTNNLLE